MFPTIVFGVIASIIGVYASWAYYDTFDLLPLILIPIGLGVALFEYLKHITTFYVLTTNKLTRKRGIIRRDTIDVRYDNIEHARTMQSISERMFGYGDIEVATAGTSVAELRLNNVTDPKKADEIIDTGKDLGRIPMNDEEEEALINHKKKMPSEAANDDDE